MASQQCEVVMMLPDGRRYSAVMTATSMYDAALKFYAYCNQGPEVFKRPKVADDAIVEVRPIYRVEMKKALAWANRPLSREEKKARQQR